MKNAAGQAWKSAAPPHHARIRAVQKKNSAKFFKVAAPKRKTAPQGRRSSSMLLRDVD